jgi:hypothetical protein
MAVPPNDPPVPPPPPQVSPTLCAIPSATQYSIPPHDFMVQAMPLSVQRHALHPSGEGNDSPTPIAFLLLGHAQDLPS